MLCSVTDSHPQTEVSEEEARLPAPAHQVPPPSLPPQHLHPRHSQTS